MKQGSRITTPPDDSAADGSPGKKTARRAVRRDRVRAELIAAGFELFREKGFDATTIVDIADAVGLSQRTFFRYFKAKDDLVFDWMDRQGEFVRPLLTARPHAEPPLIAMEQIFLQLAEFHDSNRKRLGFLTHLIYDTPALAGRYYHEHAKWEDEFVNILLRARSFRPDEMFALRVQVSTAITAFVTAIRSWAADAQRTRLRPWVGAAFATLNAAATMASAAPIPLAKTPRRSRGK